jgi:glycosyltransferase EpsD
MKKVLFVATVKEHIVKFHLPYLKLFHDNGWEVHVATNEGKNQSMIPYCDQLCKIPFQRNPFKKKNIIAYRFLKKMMIKNQYDIVHCHTPVGGVLARLAGRHCSCTRMIYTAHGFHFYKGAPLLNWMLYYPIEKICSYWTDVLITINKEDYNIAKRKFNAKKIQYIPGVGVDISKYYRDEIDRKEKREELGISSKDIVFLSVGELNRNKNHITVIKAFIQLKKEISLSHIKYFICGQGVEEKALKKIVHENCLDSTIKLLGFQTDLSKIYSAADIFIFPSMREGLPVSLMEAMSCGLPVICSQIRGNTDLIDDNGGFLFNSDSVKSCFLAIKKMMNADRKSMAQYNRNKVLKFSLNAVIEKMKLLYIGVNKND